MDNVYLLLRNNIKTGPHSINELVNLNLKTNDLIWVEGKSAAWRNPPEIDDLKFFFPDFTGSKEQGSMLTVNKKETPLPADEVKDQEVNILKKQPANIFVSLPNNLQIQGEGPDREELMGELLDQKAQELYNKVQAFSQRLEKNDSVLEAKSQPLIPDIKEESTNWRKKTQNLKKDSKASLLKPANSESLFTNTINEIKERYTDWRKEEKPGRKRGRRKPMTTAFILIFLIAFGLFWNFNSRKTTSSGGKKLEATHFKETQNRPVIKEDMPDFQNDDLPDAEFFEKQMSNNENIIEETTTPILNTKTQEEPIVKNETNTQIVIKEETGAVANNQQAVFPETASSPDIKEEEKKSVIDKQEEKKPVINKKEEEILPTSNPEPANKAEAVPFNRLIVINGDYLPGAAGDGINGYRVTMQNTSKKVLKVVAVDVFYYGAGNKLLNKKTLYFSNVSPGASMILTAPSNKWAVAASHQLGLVSSEEGALYFVSNNN